MLLGSRPMPSVRPLNITESQPLDNRARGEITVPIRISLGRRRPFRRQKVTIRLNDDKHEFAVAPGEIYKLTTILTLS